MYIYVFSPFGNDIDLSKSHNVGLITLSPELRQPILPPFGYNVLDKGNASPLLTH